MVTVTTSLPEGDSVDQSAIDQWIEALPDAFDKDDRAYLRRASLLALQAGADIRLATGEMQLRHALSVAEILTGLRLDRETLAAAMLLGALQRDQVSPESLREALGDTTARMVEDLDRIGRLTERSADDAKDAVTGRSARTADGKEHAENLRRL